MICRLIAAGLCSLKKILAAMMPEDVAWGITDENVAPIDYDEDVDCVGISFFTPQATSAYAIADGSGSAACPY